VVHVVADAPQPGGGSDWKGGEACVVSVVAVYEEQPHAVIGESLFDPA
jgi:hypothetical protein